MHMHVAIAIASAACATHDQCTALLVSETDKAAASLDVNIGSFVDREPTHAPGLAHILGHMLSVMIRPTFSGTVLVAQRAVGQPLVA